MMQEVINIIFSEIEVYSSILSEKVDIKKANIVKKRGMSPDCHLLIRISLWLKLNYKIMPRPKGSVNKVTAQVKEQLQNLIDTVMSRIDVDAMTTRQKVQLFIFIFFVKLLSQNNFKIEEVVNDEYHYANNEHCFIFHHHLFLHPFFFV